MIQIRERAAAALRRLTLLAMLLALASGAAQALEPFSNPSLDDDFSPNGDGIQDSTRITIRVRGTDALPDSIFLGIYSSANVPPAPGDLVAYPAHISETIGNLSPTEIERRYLWWGRSGADGEADPVLPDDFYYLHLWAREGADTLWLDPPTRVQINTEAPSFHSVDMQPSPFFTPLQSGADTLLYVYFNSENFDTLTDRASAQIYYQGQTGLVYMQSIERDFDYFHLVEGVGRFRLAWNGSRESGDAPLDGLHRIDLTLEDDAGNPSTTAQLVIDMDIQEPAIELHQLGEFIDLGTDVVEINSEAMAESLVVRITDRNGVADCQAVGMIDTVTTETLVGRRLDSSGFEEAFYSFQFPEAWSSQPDTLSYIRLEVDGLDQSGNWGHDIGDLVPLVINFDNEAPDAPTWVTTQTVYIQRGFLLTGKAEKELEVEVLVNGERYFPVDADDEFFTASSTTGEFMAAVDLEDTRYFPAESHTSKWIAQARDKAGNLSPMSEELVIQYHPEPIRILAGRFRGDGSDTIQYNTAEDVRSIRIRVYGLDGELHRILDLEGGPRQFFHEWDLRDSAGRRLMDGLYIFNIATTSDDGEVEYEREVVAIARK